MTTIKISQYLLLKTWKQAQQMTSQFNTFMRDCENLPNVLYKSDSACNSRFLKYVWPFFVFLYERVHV